ncbi:transposase [Puniceibacterium antarcticum]|uniref:transposase n=1 Tax=Puniceibacterium antarcticum TaxID=1206336 RepID=UPI003CCBECD2
MPGVTVADVARQHGTTRSQVYDWRKKLLTGQLVVPEGFVVWLCQPSPKWW